MDEEEQRCKDSPEASRDGEVRSQPGYDGGRRRTGRVMEAKGRACFMKKPSMSNALLG